MEIIDQKPDQGHSEETKENVVEAVVVEPSPIENKHSRDNYRFPLWATMFAIVGVFVASLFLGSLVEFIIKRTANADVGFAKFMGSAVTFSLSIGFAVWMLLRRGNSRPIMRFSLKRSDPTIILWGLILVVATSIVIEPLIALFPATNLDLLKEMAELGGWGILTAIVLVPIAEEILFRGIVQDHVTREYGGVRGVLLASALFALAHCMVPQQAVNAFFMGLILGYIYIKTGSLVPVIVIHAVNNAISYIMMSLFDSGAVMARDIIANNVVYWIVYGLCAVIFLVACVSMVRHISKVRGENAQ